MRQKNGRMSKKDRRAIQAFGLVPSDDLNVGTTMWPDSFLRMIQSNTNTVTWQNSWNNGWVGQPVAVGANWYLSMDPAPQGGHAVTFTYTTQ